MSSEHGIVMDQLAVVRHGHDDWETERLDRIGRLEIEALGHTLHVLKGDRTTIILTSPIPRADDSAKVLEDILGAPVEQQVCLKTDGDVEKAYDVIQGAGKNAKLVVAVTHLELALDLPPYIGKKVGIHVPRRSAVRNGQGVLLDLGKKTTTLLAPTAYR